MCTFTRQLDGLDVYGAQEKLEMKFECLDLDWDVAVIISKERALNLQEDRDHDLRNLRRQWEEKDRRRAKT